MRDIDKAVERASLDAGFRVQLMEDPQTALEGYDLSPEERDDLIREVNAADIGDNTQGVTMSPPAPGQPKW
jgi:hypothetical protein